MGSGRRVTIIMHILECLFLAMVSFTSCVSSQEVSNVANETYNEIDLDQLEYLCHHYYPEEFVVSAEVLESGCRLECVLLKSSGDHGSNFFDASLTKVHNLNEGLSCDTELVSNIVDDKFPFPRSPLYDHHHSESRTFSPPVQIQLNSPIPSL